MKSILKFTTCIFLSGLIFFFSCTKENIITPKTAYTDTLTRSGKEYIYPDLIWEYDDEFNPYNFIFIPALYFSFFDRYIEVSIRDNNSAAWQTIPKFFQNIPAGTISYSVFTNGILITRTISNPPDNMLGTKLSVKIKFL